RRPPRRGARPSRRAGAAEPSLGSWAGRLRDLRGSRRPAPSRGDGREPSAYAAPPSHRAFPDVAERVARGAAKSSAAQRPLPPPLPRSGRGKGARAGEGRGEGGRGKRRFWLSPAPDTPCKSFPVPETILGRQGARAGAAPQPEEIREMTFHREI